MNIEIKSNNFKGKTHYIRRFLHVGGNLIIQSSDKNYRGVSS